MFVPFKQSVYKARVFVPSDSEDTSDEEDIYMG